MLPEVDASPLCHQCLKFFCDSTIACCVCSEIKERAKKVKAAKSAASAAAEKKSGGKAKNTAPRAQGRGKR